jgi:hypothetical protein
VPALGVAGAGAWWSALEFDAAPKIIARLPFVERADHPAALPVFVISRVAADAMAKEASIWSIRVSGWGGKSAQALSTVAEFIAVPIAPSTAPLCSSPCRKATTSTRSRSAG